MTQPQAYDHQQAAPKTPLPTIGRTVHYTNLGDKDGKYPPEVQAAIITGVYANDPTGPETPPQSPGNNDPKVQSVKPANELGATASSFLVDLRVLYRTGEFNMTCVPFSPEPKRGHWNWPSRV